MRLSIKILMIMFVASTSLADCRLITRSQVVGLDDDPVVKLVARCGLDEIAGDSNCRVKDGDGDVIDRILTNNGVVCKFELMEQFTESEPDENGETYDIQAPYGVPTLQLRCCTR